MSDDDVLRLAMTSRHRFGIDIGKAATFGDDKERRIAHLRRCFKEFAPAVLGAAAERLASATKEKSGDERITGESDIYVFSPRELIAFAEAVRAK